MIVVGAAGEACEVAGKGHPRHVRGKALNLSHGKETAARLVTDAGDRVLDFGRFGHGHDAVNL